MTKKDAGPMFVVIHGKPGVKGARTEPMTHDAATKTADKLRRKGEVASIVQDRAR